MSVKDNVSITLVCAVNLHPCSVKPDLPDSSGDPGAGMMQMMQKMYEDGDDEMKKTIRKAWHESQDKKMKGEEGF